MKIKIRTISMVYLVYICKDQDNAEKLKDRQERAAHALYLTLKHLTSSVVGYMILKDTIILPWYLGGSGSL